MSSPLGDYAAITKHLRVAQSGQVYPNGPGISMNVRIDKFPGGVNIHYRPSGVIRVSMGLPIEVTDVSRDAFDRTAQALNRTGLGASVIVGTQGMIIFTQVPIGDGTLTSRVLDRTIALCIERAKSTLPILRRVEQTGLAYE